MSEGRELRSADGFQPKSRSADGFQPQSRSAEQQPQSRSAEQQPRSVDFFQIESPRTNVFRSKSRKVLPSQYVSSEKSPPWINRKEFLYQVSIRLSCHHFYEFILHLRRSSETPEETSRTVQDILGKDNRDLALTFQALITWYKSSYADSTNSPPRAQNDGMDFFDQVMSRLSDEQLSAFFIEITELNARNQTREDTLSTVEEIFGKDNKDLFLLFEGLLIYNQCSSLREASRPERIFGPDAEKFLLKASRRLSDQQYCEFLFYIGEHNFGHNYYMTPFDFLEKVEQIFGTDNADMFQSFQRLVILYIKSGMANSPPPQLEEWPRTVAIRLSDEQYYALVVYLRDAEYKTRKDILRKFKTILGAKNKDLFLVLKECDQLPPVSNILFPFSLGYFLRLSSSRRRWN